MNETKKPEIRFQGFSDKWEKYKLGDICLSFEYGLNAPAKEFDGKNKYIRITDIDDDTRMFLSQDLTSPDCNLSFAENYQLQDGDIVFARTGASVGKTFIYKRSEGIVYYAGFLIRAKIKKTFCPDFVFYNTLTSKYGKFIRVTSQRSGQPGVNAQEYAAFEFYLPRYGEQEKLGQYFRHLDNIIMQRQSKLKKLQVLKASMLEKMFPKSGTDVPEIRFKGFTKAWVKRKIGECFAERNESFPDGELLSVTINDGVRKFSELDRRDTSNNDKSKYKKVCVGDIAYNSMRMWQGASGYSPYEGIVSPAYTVLSPNPGINSKCIAYYFKSDEIVQTFQKNSQGITSDNWNLKFPALSKIEIRVSLDMEEQEKIAAYFSRFDALIYQSQQELDKLRSIKKALLEKMFV